MSPRHASRLADTGLQAGMSGRPLASARRPFPVDDRWRVVHRAAEWSQKLTVYRSSAWLGTGEDR
jgi:hypothetical protein